jgi:UDP-N-acetylglucosamine acyltransferase
MGPLVDPTATLAPSAQVAPGAVVAAGAVVGAGCVLHPYAIVGPNTTLGAGCHVHSFAVVGADAQDRRTAADAPTRLVCGPDNVFREHVTVSRGSAHGGGITRLGAGNLLMAGVHVGHDCVLGDGVTLANGVSLAGHVEIHDRAGLGGHAAVHQFARVGALAFVAANAMVSQDVPPYCLAAGDRARLLGLNVTGLRRAGLPREVRDALHRAFRLRLTGPTARRREPRTLAELETLAAHPEVRAFLAFLAEGRRGVCRAHRASQAVDSAGPG